MGLVRSFTSFLLKVFRVGLSKVRSADGKGFNPYFKFGAPVIVLLLIFILYRVVASLSQSDQTNTSLSVATVTVTKEKVSETVTSLGQLEFYEKANVSSRVSGRIERIFVREGDRVKKGDTLATIERLPLELEKKKQEAALSASDADLRMAQEKFLDAKQSTLGRLKGIEKLEAEANRVKSELDLVQVSYSGKSVLHERGGISNFEMQSVKAQLTAAEAAYLKAKKDLEIARMGFRPEDLKNRGLPVPEDPEELSKAYIDLNTRSEQAALDVARAKRNETASALESTEILLGETTVRSPIQGIVVARTKSPGEEVSSGGGDASTIVTLIDISKMFVNMQIRESDMPRIAPGMTVEFTADAIENSRFNAILKSVVPMIDPRSHTAQAKAIIDNPSADLRPGLFVRAIINLGSNKDLILLPPGAILPGENDNGYVFVVRNGRAYKRNVMRGGSLDDSRVIINDGLNEGDVVVTERPGLLREGMEVALSSSDLTKKSEDADK